MKHKERNKHVNIENMGGRDQSQIKNKKFEKSKSVPKTYQKVITMTGIGLPNSVESDSRSSYRLGTPLTEGSVPQIDAAAFTQSKTPFIEGRSVRWVCQQSSSSSQTLSERPSSSAFVGFDGFFPSMTLNTTSDPDSVPNGSVPVSTYIR